MAPKFNGKISSRNQFLSQPGKEIQQYKYNTDGTINRDDSPMTSYYTNSTRTTLPLEILNTGNIDVLQDYMKNSGTKMNSLDQAHLQERISVMKYFNELEEYNNNNPLTPVGPMQKNRKGQNVLPGIVLDRPQTTRNGCWSCAFSLLLKARGVDVPQELIRRYRPEFLEGLGPKSAKQTDTMNGDMFSEVYQYSELVGKLCPNTVVKKCTVAPLYSKQAEAKNYIIDCLTKKNTPVAMCRGGHWITIVGISDDRKQIYVSDSQQPGGTITVKDLDAATKGSLADPVEFVWTENLELDPASKKPVLNSEILSYDEKSGAITPTAKAVLASPDTQTKGIFTGDAGVEMYVPGMVRDYTRDYKTQKEEYTKFKEANKTKLELDDEKASEKFKANKKYTYMSEFTQDKAVYKLNEDILKDLESERRKELKELKILPDDVVNSMTRGEIAMQFPLKIVNQNKTKTADTASKEAKKEAKKEADVDAQGFSQKEIDAAIAASLADQQKEKKDFVDKDDAEDLETILNEIKEPKKEKSEVNKKTEEEKLKDYHPIPQNSIISDDEAFDPDSDKLNSSFKENQKLNLDDEDLAEDKHSASMFDIDLFTEEEKKKAEAEQKNKEKEQKKAEEKKEEQPKPEEKEKEQPETEVKKEEKPEAEKKTEKTEAKQEEKPETEEKAPKAESKKDEDQVDTFRRVADAFKEYRLETREITRRILAKRAAAKYAVAAQNNIRKKNAALKRLGLKEDPKVQTEEPKVQATEKTNEVKPEIKNEEVKPEIKNEEVKKQEVKEEVKEPEVDKEKQAADDKKKAIEADKAKNRKAHADFKDRVRSVQASPEPNKNLKKLQLSTLKAQAELAAAFSKNSKVDKQVMDAAAKLMTYATIEKVCSIKDTDPKTIATLTNPKNIEVYIKEIRSSGDFIKNATEALCKHEGMDHILSWDSKAIRQMMVTQLSAVTISKNKNLANKQKAQPEAAKKLKQGTPKRKSYVLPEVEKGRQAPDTGNLGSSEKVANLAKKILNNNGADFILNGKEGNVKNIVEADLKKKGPSLSH